MAVDESAGGRRPGGPASPEELGYRIRLSRGEDVVDPQTWAGSLPASSGIAPRVRVGRSRWFNLLWLLPIGFAALLAAVAAAQGLRNMPAVRHFIARYPGTLTPVTGQAHPGIPWWVDLQHFVNALFSTGQWRRIVPTTWKVFPAAGSVLIQYLSLHWPAETGWTAYNALQLLAYGAPGRRRAEGPAQPGQLDDVPRSHEAVY